jgi:ketosteroid isomerase-like protein
MGNELPPIIAKHVDAVNAGDVAAIMRTFTDGAFVNDVRREFWGADDIRGWIEREIVGPNVTMEPVGVTTHNDVIIVRARYDGDYDKTGLPPELILSNYFVLDGDLIDTMIVIPNEAR